MLKHARALALMLPIACILSFGCTHLTTDSTYTTRQDSAL